MLSRTSAHRRPLLGPNSTHRRLRWIEASMQVIRRHIPPPGVAGNRASAPHANASCGNLAQAIHTGWVELLQLRRIQVDLQTKSSRHHFIGGCPLHAALRVNTGIDAADESRWRQPHVARSAKRCYPRVVERGVNGVELVAPAQRLRHRQLRRCVQHREVVGTGSRHMRQQDPGDLQRAVDPAGALSQRGAAGQPPRWRCLRWLRSRPAHAHSQR